MMFDFVDGATGEEIAAKQNMSAFEQIKLQPRVLENVEGRHLATDVFGESFGLPFGIAPMGMCNLVWPDADRMLASEAAKRGIPLCASSAASTSLEDMAALAGERAWFQLYVGQSREAAFNLVDRAATAGYRVLVLTVDTPQISRRIRDLKNGFKVPFRMGPKQVLDFALHPHWSLSTLVTGPPLPMNFETAGREFERGESRGGIDWTFLDQLRARWTERLVVKGVMSAEDSVRIRDAGADAVYVSNHGGRQLDSAPPAIHALPQIRAAVGPDYPLLFDSGLRGGEDIVKALALGADFVMLGRPILYAIGAGGAPGLARLIECIADDIGVAMAQIGRRRIADIDSTVLAEPADEPAQMDPEPEVLVPLKKADNR